MGRMKCIQLRPGRHGNPDSKGILENCRDTFMDRPGHRNRNKEKPCPVLYFMTPASKVAIFCGFILFLFFLCPGVTAVDNQAEQYYNSGVTSVQQGRYDEAVALFDNAVAVDPTLTEAWYNRGVVLIYLKNYPESLTSLDKALALRPDFSDAWTSRGIALHQMGKYDEALTSFDKAIALNMNDAKAWNNRGLSLLKLGRSSDAIASFNQAIVLKPEDLTAKNNRDSALALEQTQASPLLFAPVGALVLVAGIAVWSRRRTR